MKIRDFFWPLLEKAEKKQYKDFSSKQIKLRDSNIKIAFELLLKNVEDEKERLKIIESKSATFIWILSISITILFYFSKFIFQPAFEDIYGYAYNSILFLILILILLYSFRSVFFSLQALRRKAYYQTDYQDLVDENNSSEYMKKIMSKTINNLNRNSETINEKVDYLTLSQEYFLRAIFSIIVFELIIMFNQLLNYIIKICGN